LSQATYEYPAYALQIESLAPSVRDLFLQSFGQRAIKVNSIFSDSTLLFDPYFLPREPICISKLLPTGAAILDGEASFIAPPM